MGTNRSLHVRKNSLCPDCLIIHGPTYRWCEYMVSLLEDAKEAHNRKSVEKEGLESI